MKENGNNSEITLCHSCKYAAQDTPKLLCTANTPPAWYELPPVVAADKVMKHAIKYCEKEPRRANSEIRPIIASRLHQCEQYAPQATEMPQISRLDD